VAHPKALGNIGDAATQFRMSQTIEHRTFEVAHFNGLLFCDPVFCVTEKMPGPDQDEAKLGPVERLPEDSFGAGSEDDELWLGDHAVNFHGGRM
jgi:hypothetical protein